MTIMPRAPPIAQHGGLFGPRVICSNGRSDHVDWRPEYGFRSVSSGIIDQDYSSFVGHLLRARFDLGKRQWTLRHVGRAPTETTPRAHTHDEADSHFQVRQAPARFTLGLAMFATRKAHGIPWWPEGRPFSRPAVSSWLPSVGSPTAIRAPGP